MEVIDYCLGGVGVFHVWFGFWDAAEGSTHQDLSLDWGGYEHIAEKFIADIFEDVAENAIFVGFGGDVKFLGRIHLLQIFLPILFFLRLEAGCVFSNLLQKPIFVLFKDLLGFLQKSWD